MSEDKIYPLVLLEDFVSMMNAGGKVIVRIVESKSKLGFAWRPFIRDVNGVEHVLVVKRTIKPRDFASGTAVMAFGQEIGLEYFETLPVPDPKKYKVRTDALSSKKK